MPVFHSTLAGSFSIEEVASVKLHAGLVGVEFHGATGLWIPENSGLTQTFAIYCPAVVVALAELEGNAFCLNPISDDGGSIEIERGIFDFGQVSVRDEGLVGREEILRWNSENMVVDGIKIGLKLNFALG